jgi:hypothetical protein
MKMHIIRARRFACNSEISNRVCDEVWIWLAFHTLERPFTDEYVNRYVEWAGGLCHALNPQMRNVKVQR